MPRRLSMAFVTVLVALLAACGSSPPPPASDAAPVARVGPTTITQAAFAVRLQSTLKAIQAGGGPTSNPAMQTRVRAGVLRGLILDTIIAQEARAIGLAATDSEVQAEVDQDAHNAGGTSALETQLAAAGDSLAQLQDEIRSRINEARLEDHFAKERADQVEQMLSSGADFVTTAQQWSDDTGTNAKGGDLGALTPDDLKTYDPSFAAAVAMLGAGQYTKALVHDAGGYDIIEVYAVAPAARSVRHILVAAPTPYTVRNRPTWFTASLFATVAQECQQNQIQVYITDAGANPCSGAPALSPGPASGG